jgi:hypothetical protein
MAEARACLGRVSFRSPTIQRLCLNFISFQERNGSIKDVITNEKIDFSAILHPEIDGVMWKLPTSDLNLLATTLLKIVRCYKYAPEIHSKISILWAMCEVGAIIMPGSEMAGANSRAKEIKELDKALYEISEKITGMDVVATASFEESSNPSQYIMFEVKVV